MRQLAFGRLILLAIALTAVFFTVKFAIDSNQWRNEFYEWVDARPMDTEVRLSEPGTYTVPFAQTCVTSDGVDFYIDIAPIDGSLDKTVDALDGLTGSVTIHDVEGRKIDSADFGPQTIGVWEDWIDRDVDRIVLTGIRSFPVGDYTATLQIDTVADGFSTEPQTIYAKYPMNGLHLFPATLLTVLACVIGFIAFVLTCGILPGLWRHGIWRGKPVRSSSTVASEANEPKAH